MKTFEQALEEESREQENHVFRMEPWKEITHSDSFKIGAQWAIQNLHLLDAKDLLKHEGVVKVVRRLKASMYYQEKLKFYLEHNSTCNIEDYDMPEDEACMCGLDAIAHDNHLAIEIGAEALKPFEDET